MKANVFRGINRFGIEDVERPRAGAGEAVIRVTLTTICGTDLHIVRGEYPVDHGRIIGHEPTRRHRIPACILESSSFPTMPSQPVSVTTALSRRCAQAAKNACFV